MAATPILDFSGLLIRPARESDIERLRLIEVQAGREFADYGLADIADAEPMAPSVLGGYIAVGRAWVVVDPAIEGGDVAVAYVVVDLVDRAAHVEQLTVAPSHQRRGVGRSLLDQVDAWAAERDLESLTLTTFSDVPWNAPYYERLGFVLVPDDQLTPGLAAIRATESGHGLDPQLRICMRRPVRTPR